MRRLDRSQWARLPRGAGVLHASALVLAFAAVVARPVWDRIDPQACVDVAYAERPGGTDPWGRPWLRTSAGHPFSAGPDGVDDSSSAHEALAPDPNAPRLKARVLAGEVSALAADGGPHPTGKGPAARPGHASPSWRAAGDDVEVGLLGGSGCAHCFTAVPAGPPLIYRWLEGLLLACAATLAWTAAAQRVRRSPGGLGAELVRSGLLAVPPSLGLTIATLVAAPEPPAGFPAALLLVPFPVAVAVSLSALVWLGLLGARTGLPPAAGETTTASSDAGR